jgi:hypothetical protein
MTQALYAYINNKTIKVKLKKKEKEDMTAYIRSTIKCTQEHIKTEK